jgi:hypothetical protein
VIDDEHIDDIGRQARHVALRKVEQVWFFTRDLLNLQHLGAQCFVKGIFDKGDARENLPRGKDLRRPRRDQLAQPINAEVVDSTRTLQLAETDQRHLHQTAFVTPVKIGMRLDSIDQNRAVRLVYVTIHEDAERQISLRQLNDIHRGAHGGADGVFGNAVELENVCLTLGRRSAVASHRRDDEGMRASRFHVLSHFLHDEREVIDAATTGGDGNPHVRTNRRIQFRELTTKRHARILEAIPVEALSDLEELMGPHGAPV